MVRNDTLRLILRPEPDDSTIRFSSLAALVKALDALILQTARPAEGGHAYLRLAAEPRRGSIELNFILDVSIAVDIQSFLGRLADRNGITWGELLSRSADAAGLLSFLLFSPWGLIARRQGTTRRPPADLGAHHEAIRYLAHALERHAGSEADEVAHAAQATGCASVTIEYRDLGPVELTRPEPFAVEDVAIRRGRETAAALGIDFRVEGGPSEYSLTLSRDGAGATEVGYQREHLVQDPETLEREVRSYAAGRPTR